MPNAKSSGAGEFSIGVAGRRRSLGKEAEDIDALPRGGLEGNAERADERKSVREQEVVSALERAGADDRAAVHYSGDRVDVPYAGARGQGRADRPASRERNPTEVGSWACQR